MNGRKNLTIYLGIGISLFGVALYDPLGLLFKGAGLMVLGIGLICLFFGLFSFVLFAHTDFDLAENYFDKGEFEKALIIYQKLQKDTPGNLNLVFRIIEIQQELQHFDLINFYYGPNSLNWLEIKKLLH